MESQERGFTFGQFGIIGQKCTFTEGLNGASPQLSGRRLPNQFTLNSSAMVPTVPLSNSPNTDSAAVATPDLICKRPYPSFGVSNKPFNDQSSLGSRASVPSPSSLTHAVPHSAAAMKIATPSTDTLPHPSLKSITKSDMTLPMSS